MTRVVAFQTAGCIGEIGAWVDGAISQLVCTGAHVGIYTETKIHPVDRHTRIINAFKTLGFWALSHNTSSRQVDCAQRSPEDDVFGPRAAGVIVVVSDKYASWWTDIAYDTFGKAIAANLELSDGATVRIVCVYGVSGANCSNFVSFPAKKKAESIINEFIRSQAKLCDEKGLRMIVAGDINSYSQAVLDHNGGPSYVRPESLTSTLLALGFHDTFRQRFPTTTAFTRISQPGGSRLEHIWVRPAPGLHFETFSSCIIWDWPFQTDHCPVVADFLSTIPTIDEKIDRPPQPRWRVLLSEAADKELNAKMREDDLGKIGPYKDLMETTRGELLKVREAAHNRDKMDPGKAMSIIENAYLAIENTMLGAIPWPEIKTHNTKELCCWRLSIRLLDKLQKRLRRSQHTVKVIKSINKAWRKALQRTITLSRSRSSRKVFRPSQDAPRSPFYSSPSEWAMNLGFDTAPIDEWANTRHTLKDVSSSSSTDPLLS